MVRKILEENLVSIPEVKEILNEVVEKVKTKNPEAKLDAFQEATQEYVNLFAKMSGAHAKKVVKLLVDEYKMDPALAIQVVNIAPQYFEELRTIFEKDPKFKNLPEAKLNEIIELLRE